MRRIMRGAVRRMGRFRWATALGRRVVPFDVALQWRTVGRLSILRMVGIPSLLLTTTGRRSGTRRSVPLLYVPYGPEYLVVGSNWGGARHPSWTANLLAESGATVQSAGSNCVVRARRLTGAELDHVWKFVLIPAWPAYLDYQQRAGDRTFRVFALRPTCPVSSE